MLELRKISVRQGGQRAEGVTVEEEVEMVLDGALRTWESHPVETAFVSVFTVKTARRIDRTVRFVRLAVEGMFTEGLAGQA